MSIKTRFNLLQGLPITEAFNFISPYTPDISLIYHTFHVIIMNEIKLIQPTVHFLIIDREASEIIRLVASVRPSVCPSVCRRSNF